MAMPDKLNEINKYHCIRLKQCQGISLFDNFHSGLGFKNYSSAVENPLHKIQNHSKLS